MEWFCNAKAVYGTSGSVSHSPAVDLKTLKLEPIKVLPVLDNESLSASHVRA